MIPDQPPANGNAKHYRLGFRKDVEGLRAVAILLVVAAHAKVSWLAGGFVGVDVFFVLSGYLITGLLVQEIRTTGMLQFADFYMRRLRRLLPGMLIMIGITGLLGWLLLPVDGQNEQASAAASSALWLSNFHFAFSSMDYFSPGSETNLYLHTWSLAVEEQFYLAWPLLVVLAMGAWQGARKTPTHRNLAWIMAALLVGSFLLALHWTYTSPQLGFYMMPARAWQFALGALVLLGIGTPDLQPITQLLIGPSTRCVAGWLGLSLILASALVLDGSFPYPGFWAALPSVGTALLLVSGGTGNVEGGSKLLSLRPMQALGGVSYFWYLWHWPVLILGAAVLGAGNAWNRATLVLISLGIAAASYHFIEKPIRRQRILIMKPRLAVFSSVALMLVAGFLGCAGKLRPHLRCTAANRDRTCWHA